MVIKLQTFNFFLHDLINLYYQFKYESKLSNIDDDDDDDDQD